MIYDLNIIVWEISPLLLENVALRMGNLQVSKSSCGREWTPHKCVSLGALIRNGMGLWLYFLFLTYCLWIFLWINDELRLYETFMMRPACQRLLWLWNNSAARLLRLFCYTLKEYYLIFSLIFMKEYVTFRLWWFTLILFKQIFMLGKRVGTKCV
jgi:hypothetical protein